MRQNHKAITKTQQYSKINIPTWNSVSFKCQQNHKKSV
jgi:hypothetical protein